MNNKKPIPVYFNNFEPFEDQDILTPKGEEHEIDLPLEWNILEDNKINPDTKVNTAGDGLILSLVNLGHVDIEYISNVTNLSKDEVILSLGNSIFQNPDKWDKDIYSGYETSEEYLSGNLKKKWLRAYKENNKCEDDRFLRNIQALEEIMPPSLANESIYITLGSPWVPTDIIEDFIIHLFGTKYRQPYNKKAFQIKHDPITGTWEIPEKMRYGTTINPTKIYGTSRLNALHIIERTLNMKAIVVNDREPIPGTKDKERNVVNQSETLLALEKQKRLINEFKDWVWQDEERKERLEKIYETKYAYHKAREYNGSFLTFPGMNPNYSLYSHQKNAVARIIFSPNTLLAHEVGSGKTYIMIAAGMELKRMGLSKKNLYVVPNNILYQWKEIFLNLYPNANILCVDPTSFRPEKRNEILARIKDEEFDAIIMAYSSFELIPNSSDSHKSKLKEEKEEIEKYLKEGKDLTSKLLKKYQDLHGELHTYEMVESLGLKNPKPDKIFFDELGITRLFVDEAHNYKNIPLDTKIDRVLGLPLVDSSKCKDMLDKVRIIQRDNNGGGIVFATGTPITNSLSDIFVMQKYLQNGELTLLDLQSFDSWIGMFAEKHTEFEVDVDTNNFRLATRFSKFHNLVELTSLISSIADFKKMDNTDDVPILESYINEEVERSDEFKNYLLEISERAEKVRAHKVRYEEDNMLKITIDGRKAALDLRLVNPNALPSPLSKVNKCIDNVAKIYYETTENLSTQLIFCDVSTPKAGFNIYDDLKVGLMLKGIPMNEIAFVHSARSEKQREKLFTAVREGKIRILIGSTFKLGLGVNVQNKLIALHHLDVPWRPADMTQREGRILRQGNENEKVYIYRYVTQGSFDAYNWQLLETKQRFISAILEGSMKEREEDDIDNTVLSYAEVKALAIGNPTIKERFETANELDKMIILQNKYRETRFKLEAELDNIPKRKFKIEHLIENTKIDIEQYQNSPLHQMDKKDLVEFKKECNDKIYAKLTNNLLLGSDNKFSETTVIDDYYGFVVTLPLDSSLATPYVIINGTNDYMVRLGDAHNGYAIRLDNRLEKLENDLEKLKDDILALEDKEAQIIAELNKGAGYSNEIERLKDKLRSIDQMLGVDEDGKY